MLIDTYANWVKEQPREIIRQNLQITRQNLAEIEVSPDLSERDRSVIGAVWRQRAEVEEAALAPTVNVKRPSLTVTMYAADGRIASGPLKGGYLEDAVAELRRAGGGDSPIDLVKSKPYRGSWRQLWRDVIDVTISQL